MKPLLRVHPDEESLGRAAARLLVERLGGARPGARASLALSGGRTPLGLYELLASPEFAGRIPWPEIEVYWTDERCVPPDHPDSNYGAAERLLLSKVPVRPANVHRIRGEAGPGAAAREYEETLKRAGRGCDVVLLGAGEDGHTASLFPGDAALEEREAWAAPAAGPGGPRVTMTLPYLCLGADLVVLASGARKAPVVAAAARGDDGPLPVLRLKAAKPVLWLVNRDAAPSTVV